MGETERGEKTNYGQTKSLKKLGGERERGGRKKEVKRER